MALYSVGTDSCVTNVLHEAKFRYWLDKLSRKEIQDIKDELIAKIGSTEIQTSSWMPGGDWSGTIFQPIYEKACGQDFEASAKCFGLIVWAVFMGHPKTWGFGRFEKDGFPIRGITYFQVDQACNPVEVF